MNSEEQTLIDGLFSRLQQAETDSAPRDAQAEARIKEHMARQPAVGYYMTQSILVQEHALQSLDVGSASVAGLAIVIMAIMLDRITTAASERSELQRRRGKSRGRRDKITLAVLGKLSDAVVGLFERWALKRWA